MGAARHPDRVALFALRERLSYEAADRAVDALARGLQDRGVVPGSVLAGFFEKRLSLPLVFLAAARLGAVFAPLNQRLTVAQLRSVVAELQIGAFFTELDHLPLLSALRPHLPPSAPLVVLQGEGPAGYLRLEGLLESPTGGVAEPPDDPDLLVYLNFTSGTTGTPRGALTTHRNLEAGTRAACEGLGLTAEDVHLCLFAPYAHPHEIFARALYLGGTAVLHDSMSPKALGNIIEKASVTCVMAVPPLYDVSLRAQLESRLYRLSSLRLLEAGGMATPSSLIAEMADVYGLTLVPVWGSTETTGIALAGDPQRRDGLLSRVLPGFEMKVVSEADRPLPVGESGELVVSGDPVVSGYLGMDTDPSLSGGTFRTGDLVRLTGSGLQHLGRGDEMRKVGGLKVHPQEVEIHLRQHPGVQDAAVTFREDRSRGWAPVAVLVLEAEASTPTLAELKRFLRDRVPSGSFPRDVTVVSALPRTSAGKLDRRALERALAGRGETP